MNWAVADQALVSGCNFLTGIMLARLLGLESYGVFTLAWLVVLFFNSLQLATVIQPMMSLSPKYEYGKLNQFYGSMFLLQCLWVVIYSILLLMGFYFESQFEFIKELNGFFIPVFLVLVSFQLQDFFRRVCFSLEEPSKAFISDLISYAGRLILFILLHVYFELTIDYTLYSIAFISIIALLPIITIAGKFKLKHRDHLFILKENYHFSKWLLGSALLQWTTGNYFFVVAGVLLGPIAVGAVKACQNIIGITHVLFQAMENFVPTQASKELHKGIRELNKYLLKLACIGGLGTVLIIIIVVGFSEPLLKLVYGKEYVEYSYLMNWFGVLYCLTYLSLPIRAGLRAIEKNSIVFSGYIISTAFSLLSAKQIVNLYSELGVVLGSILSQLIMLSVLSVYFIINIIRRSRSYT